MLHENGPGIFLLLAVSGCLWYLWPHATPGGETVIWKETWMSKDSLWDNESAPAWRAALDAYGDVIARQGVEKLPVLDSWYRDELPALVAARKPAYMTYAELVRVTEWKMARGVWRAPNLVLVRSNPADFVEETSAAAFAKVPHPSEPIATLAKLAGVGPATASAAVNPVDPSVYPFFDELVAAQVPGLGQVKFTPREYARYADALRKRATLLGGLWSASDVERALWAHVGGKGRVHVGP